MSCKDVSKVFWASACSPFLMESRANEFDFGIKQKLFFVAFEFQLFHLPLPLSETFLDSVSGHFVAKEFCL